VQKIELMYSQAQQERLKPNLMNRFQQTIDEGMFIQGKEVSELEDLMAQYNGASHAVNCANGTDALTIALLSINTHPQDVVFTPSFTYVASAEAISLIGAQPYFVDIDPATFNLCPDKLEDAIKHVKFSLGLNPKAIIAVDLFGNPCRYQECLALARHYNLTLIADSAQAFGANYNGRKVGAIADITTTSFFPTKPLGCYGDGGMIFTNEADLANKIRSICFHGKGRDKYEHVRVGMNSRLDTLQAVVLLEKMKFFDDELKQRRQLAAFYNTALQDVITTPNIAPEDSSAWAVYTLRSGKRDIIIQELKERGIPSNVYYHTPLHLQPAYKHCLQAPLLSASNQAAKEVFCLPMHAYVTETQKHYIVDNMRDILQKIKINEV
jgi:dTDP-4-amino-4,6-dideoxygalactose transaminase